MAADTKAAGATAGPPLTAMGISPWSVGVVAVAALLAIPVLLVLGFVLVPAGEVWDHLAATVLRDYVSNSLLLMLGVAIGTLILGVGAAWLTSMCAFPGRAVFEWALLLPMALRGHAPLATRAGLAGLRAAGEIEDGLHSHSDSAQTSIESAAQAGMVAIQFQDVEIVASDVSRRALEAQAMATVAPPATCRSLPT